MMCNGTCAKCHVELVPFTGQSNSLDVDHIYPQSRGGPDALWNPQPLCARCNRSKGNTSTIDHRPAMVQRKYPKPAPSNPAAAGTKTGRQSTGSRDQPVFATSMIGTLWTLLMVVTVVGGVAARGEPLWLGYVFGLIFGAPAWIPLVLVLWIRRFRRRGEMPNNKRA